MKHNLPFSIGTKIYMVHSNYLYPKNKKPQYEIIEHIVESIIINEAEILPAMNGWDGYVPVSESYYDPETNQMEDSPYFTNKYQLNNFMESIEEIWERKKENDWLGEVEKII